MASSSSAQHTVLASLGFLPVSEKLTRGNFPGRRAQVLSSIRGAEVYEFLSPMAEPPRQVPAQEGRRGEGGGADPQQGVHHVGRKGPTGPELSAGLRFKGDSATDLHRDYGRRGMGRHRGVLCLSISREVDQYQDGLGDGIQGYFFHCRLLLQDEVAR